MRDNVTKTQFHSKVKDDAYIIYLDEYADIGNWVALYINGNAVTYFDSLKVKNIPKELRKFINGIAFSGSTIKINIFRIQEYDSVMSGYFCIGFIDFMLF